jgi:hypothetical protein
MNDDGFKKWLAGEDLKPKTRLDAMSLCREMEPLLRHEFGDLDELVRLERVKDAEAWLFSNAEMYVVRGQMMREGAKKRIWALRKYAKYVLQPNRARGAGA